MMFLSRQMTVTKRGDDDQERLDTVLEEDSSYPTPEASRKFAPSRMAPTLPSSSANISTAQQQYSTPSSQMIPKMKPRKQFGSPLTSDFQKDNSNKMSSPSQWGTNNKGFGTSKPFLQRWDKGDLSREESESQLSGDLVGSFLVRSSKGQKVLSLKDGARVKHIKLIEQGGRITGDNNDFFNSIEDLINFYKEHPI